MKKITIARNGIEAVILPDFGGMVAQLRIHGRNVLRMYYEKLGLSNVLAGGIPISFPLRAGAATKRPFLTGKPIPCRCMGLPRTFPFKRARSTRALRSDAFFQRAYAALLPV